jgi:FHS family glucose/mannose:H+ symporter-like MFS transporter
MAPLSSRGPRFSLLCFGFVVCGIVTVLPGPLLPLMAARWGLRDVQSGAFFAAEFAASMVGSIYSPRRLRQNLPLGYAVMTGGVLLLIFARATEQAAVGHALALTSFGLIGLGTGLSVTATNLVVGMMEEGAGAQRGASTRARRISVVNLWWGMGAVACPWMVAAAVHGGHVQGLLLLMAVGTAAMFAALLPQIREPEPGLAVGERASARAEAGTLVFFAAFFFLYLGVETVVGGWIPTYAHRFSGMTLAHASLTVSLYWMALLAGRLAGSVALRSVTERAVLIPALGLALIAVATLVAPHSTATVLVAVAAAGAGFGPVFPIGVSRMLSRVRDHRNTGWAFAMCSAGGATLPWLTGLVSTGSGSLRIGFAVPLAALAVILALAVGENAALGGKSLEHRAQSSGA